MHILNADNRQAFIIIMDALEHKAVTLYLKSQYNNINTTCAAVSLSLNDATSIYTPTTATGAPCNILGSWNSEIIGLRFDIQTPTTATLESETPPGGTNGTAAANTTPAPTTPAPAKAAAAGGGDALKQLNVTKAEIRRQLMRLTMMPSADADSSGSQPDSGHLHDLTVRLFDHNPPKRNTMMDTNWTAIGHALYTTGGPFAIVTSTGQKHDRTLATFTGECAERAFGGGDCVRLIVRPPVRACRCVQGVRRRRDDVRHVEHRAAVPRLHRSADGAGDAPRHLPQGHDEREEAAAAGGDARGAGYVRSHLFWDIYRSTRSPTSALSTCLQRPRRTTRAAKRSRRRRRPTARPKRTTVPRRRSRRPTLAAAAWTTTIEHCIFEHVYLVGAHAQTHPPHPL